MNNVIDFAAKKNLLEASKAQAEHTIERALALLDQDFIGSLETAKDKHAFIKSVKGILNSRNIKYKASIKELKNRLNKKTTLLFIDEKIGFSLDITTKAVLCETWKIYPFKECSTPAENAGLISEKLNEAKKNG